MEIKSSYLSGRLTVSMSGELDHHAAKQTTDTICEAMDACLPRELILDMTQLGFMDSSGIAVIMKVSKKLQLTKGKMAILSPQPQPLKVLEAAGIGRIIPIKTKWEVTT